MIKNYKIFKESLLNEGVVEKTRCNNIAYYVTDIEELKKVYDFAYKNGYSFFGEDTYEPDDLNIKILYLINTQGRTKTLKYNMVYTGGFDKEKIYNDYINYWNRDEDLDLLVTKSIKDIKIALSTFNINDYTKPKRLVYESLLNKLEGPNEEEVRKNVYNLDSYKMLLLGIELQDYDIIDNAIFKDHDTLFTFEWEILQHILEHKKLIVLGYLIDNYNFNFEIANTILYELNAENKEVYTEKYIKEVLDFLEKYEDKEEVKPLSKKDKFKKFTKKLFHKESLLNKIEGPSKEEIESNLKQMYLDGKIDILEWYSKAVKFNVEGPNKEQINDYYNEHTANEILLMSCSKNFLDGVIYALKKNADIDYNFSTPLKNACYYGHLDIVEYLVEHGADYNPYDTLAPLHLAIEGGDKEVIDYLFELYSYRNIIRAENKDDLIRTARKYGDEDTLLYIRKKVENI